MLRAFSTSATGMQAQQMMVDVIANNLANINTTGFKRSQINFQDLLYIKMKEAGTEVVAGVTSPSGLDVGSGVKPASTVKVFTMGELSNTGNPLDIAISGEGFFEVAMANGDKRYTRDGALGINSNGVLVTITGFPIEPSITIPEGATVGIGNDGSVNIIDSAGAVSIAGTIGLVRFQNPAGLSSEGDNLLSETPASGSPLSGTAGEGGFGSLQSGFLEKSNVQMVSELVNLITAQRAYEINSRAIRAGDDMLKTANQIVR